MTDSLKTDILGLLSLVEITVPRWAADEPVPGKMIDVAELPNDLEQEKLSFQGGRSYYHRADVIDPDYQPGIAVREPTQTQMSQSIFDKNGNLIEVRKFEGPNEVENTTYEYNFNGQMIERKLADPFDEVSERETLTYGGNDKTISRRIEYTDGSVTYTEYLWSQNVCEEVTTDDGVKTRKRTTYDTDGRVTEEIGSCDNGAFGCGMAWTYDSAGRLVEQFIVQPNGNRVLSELTEYDDTGNLIRWSQLDTDGSTIQQKECQYENGRLLSDVLYERDNETRTTYEYNSDNLLIRSFAVSEVAEEEQVYSYGENKLLMMTACRSSERHFARNVRVYSTASTTWRIYQFYDKQ